MTPRRRAVLALAAAWPLPAVVAAPGGLPNAAHTDGSPQWERLRERLFAQRPIEPAAPAGRGLLRLDVPLRAAYGASVPVKVVSLLPQSPALYVRRLYVVVDKNPSPLAMLLALTPDIGQADFETRLRVDEYSHVRAVIELSNGELHMDSRYVKTSGGCSAPPNRDAPHLIGRTVFKLPEGVKPQAATPAELTVLHPNDTGFELDQRSVMYIPPHFVRHVAVSYAGAPLFDAELDFSVSENPSLRFRFLPRAGGELRAEVEDSLGGRFNGRLAVVLP